MRLLNYNVWFNEGVALATRMQGLSDVIMETKPHVISLQEVTPNILMLLHAFAWFEEYKVGRYLQDLLVVSLSCSLRGITAIFCV